MSALSRPSRSAPHRNAAPISALARIWNRYEGPTWCVALMVYGGWFVLIRFHALLPWWAIIPIGAWLVAWHGSLQHETIHAFTSAPRPVRMALASVPLGVFFPYGSYVREHRRHHRSARLTDPSSDPESFYHDAQRWQRYPAFIRMLLRANQTLLGRLTLGAALQTAGAMWSDARRVAHGDRRPLRDWTIHLMLTGGLLAWVWYLAGMPWWEYIAFIAYPGASLAMLRSFYEHAWDPDPQRRTAVVENRFPFGLLFLNNNYHVVHHASPALPWFRIPAVWNAQRDAYIEGSGERYVRGYSAIARRWLVRAICDPVSPGR